MRCVCVDKTGLDEMPYIPKHMTSNEDYEGYDKRKTDQKEECDAGSLSFWRQTVRKRGSTQDGKTPCRSGIWKN